MAPCLLSLSFYLRLWISYLACYRCPVQETWVWHSACCRCPLRESEFGVLPAVVALEGSICCCGFRTLPAVVALCKRPGFGTLPAVAVLCERLGLVIYLLSLPLQGLGFGTLPAVAVPLPAVVDFLPCLLSLPCARDLGLGICLLSLSFERD